MSFGVRSLGGRLVGAHVVEPGDHGYGIWVVIDGPGVRYDYLFSTGLCYGYPLCCIRAFCKDVGLGRLPASMRGSRGALKYVPCPMHYRMLRSFLRGGGGQMLKDIETVYEVPRDVQEAGIATVRRAPDVQLPERKVA